MSVRYLLQYRFHLLVFIVYSLDQHLCFLFEPVVQVLRAFTLDFPSFHVHEAPRDQQNIAFTSLAVYKQLESWRIHFSADLSK